MQYSLLMLGVWTGYFFFMLHISMFKSLSNRELSTSIIKLSWLFVFVSFILNSISLFLPIDQFISSGYQFVFSKFGSHNHLGDFLGLGIVFTFYHYLISKKVSFLLGGALFFVFFIFSFSRSAYVAFAVSSIFFLLLVDRSLRKKGALFLVAVLLLLSCSLFISVKQNPAKALPGLHSANLFLREFGLKEKYLFGTRPEYWNQAVQSIQEQPLGIGPGNFQYASLTFKRIHNSSHSAHNIFLDIFVEHGIIAGFFFLLFLLFVLWRAFFPFTIYSLAFIYLLVLFQFDYSYRIYSFGLLFFVLIGIILNQYAKTKSAK